MRKPDESKKIRNLTRRTSIKTTGWKKKNAIPRSKNGIVKGGVFPRCVKQEKSTIFLLK